MATDNQLAELFGFEIRAIDIRLNVYSLLIQYEDTERPYLCEISCRSWTEDRKKIMFMLDNHSTFWVGPEEMVRVVPFLPSGFKLDALVHQAEKDRETMQLKDDVWVWQEAVFRKSEPDQKIELEKENQAINAALLSATSLFESLSSEVGKIVDKFRQDLERVKKSRRKE